MALNSNMKFGNYTIEEICLKLFNIDMSELSKDISKQTELSEKAKMLKLLKVKDAI
jgi:hypothetical protein